MEHSIEIMAAIVFLIFGLSYIFYTNDWIEWLETVRTGGRQASLLMGTMHLLLGSFIVAFHWVWSGWGTVLTVLGLWAIVEGTVYLLFPDYLAKFMTWLRPYYALTLRAFGVGIGLYALALFYQL